MRIINCKVNHLTNPLGYHMEKPVFSYEVTEARGKKQNKARICISETEDMKDLLYDTDYRADIDSLAYTAEITLKPRTRYYWTAAVITDSKEEAISEVNWFETGKMEEEWQAKWISCDSSKERHPIFTRDLPEAEKKINSARLYICGLGLYEAYINGKKISKEFFTPYCNNYNQWLQYQTYDISEELKPGGKLEVMLGNGWYKGRFGYDGNTNHKAYYGDTWKLIAEVRITYTDGSEYVFGTDESWKVKRSRITASNIYDGETYDANLEEATEGNAVLCAEKLKTLTGRLSTPVTIQEELVPAELIRTVKGETVLDLGQNFAGIFRLRVSEPKGRRIRLQFGEILQGGNFYRDNLRGAKAEYIYISDGTESIIQPHFTFYGYRYVKIEGVTNLKKDDFTGLALYSELTQTGRLATGHELVNKLIQNALWGQKSNFLDVPTDCPQRDERMGWTGDAQVFCPTACFQMDSYAFYKKYLFDMTQEQKENNGQVPYVVPSFGIKASASVWGDAACIMPWNLYLFYGDKNILSEQYSSMKAWVDYVEAVDGDDHGWRKIFHFGDWLALDNPAGVDDQVMGGTNTGFIASVYFANSARLTAKAAKLLDKPEEARHYEAISDKQLEAVRREYYSESGRPCINTQTALIMSLYFHIVDNTEYIMEALNQRFLASKGKLQTGFVGTPLLCNVLSENGMDDLAYKLLLNEEYPGWLYEVKMGATTIWERWNSVNPDGSISSTGMNSLNHYAYGSIAEWIYRHAAGINPVEEVPGFKRIKLSPTPKYELGFLKAEYHSPAGTYKSEWKFTDETHVELHFTIPFDCEAELKLPYEEKHQILTSGEYVFNYETTTH